jgi:hypothetical protein
VERYFRGWEANYNDVPSWNYSQLFEAFAPDSGAKGFKITTEAQLDELLNDPQVQNASYPQVSEASTSILIEETLIGIIRLLIFSWIKRMHQPLSNGSSRTRKGFLPSSRSNDSS